MKLSTATAEIGARMRERLRGPATGAANVVWQQEGRQVLIFTESLVVRCVDGWIICSLDVQSDQTGRQTLEFVFCLGTPDRGRGVQAASTVNAASLPAAQVADYWGADLQRVLWDAVVDVVEASVTHAHRVERGKEIVLGGFHCDGDAVHVDVAAVDR